MLMNNIFFDTFFGLIIDPTTYKTLKLLDYVLSNRNHKYPKGIHNLIYDAVNIYVEKLSPQKKQEYKQLMYYIIMHKFLVLQNSGRTLQQLFNPENHNDYLILKTHLLPLLTLMADINPEENSEYNSFCYKYLLNNEEPNKIINELYIIENISDPNIRIISIASDQIDNYIKLNKLILTITGCLFYRHDAKKSIGYEFLEHRLKMRKIYKSKMYDYPVGSEDYKFFDSRQNSCKINANSAYGVTGLSTFRFSNSLLAKTVTVSGRMLLKIAQVCADEVLKDMSKE